MHSLSAAAIEDVTITDGEERPILIEIRMNNSSGIYQVDGLLKAKLRGSGLEPRLRRTAAAQVANVSNDDVMRVGRHRVTPVARIASRTRNVPIVFCSRSRLGCSVPNRTSAFAAR